MSRARPRRPVARPADAPGLSARRAALDMLDAVMGSGDMLDERPGAAAGAERAEARGLADLTLRRLGQIDAVLDRFVHRTPPGTGQQILRLMAAELLFNGTPPHAAVDLAVRLAQGRKRTARLSGLVNAVGRKLAAEGAVIVASQDPVTLNTPKWLAKALKADWGPQRARAIAEAHLVPAPHDLTLRTQGDAAVLGAETGGEVLPTGSLRLPGRPQISALPGYAEGAWWVQDTAAAIPARLLRPAPGQRILDLCAAPGGKTLQLAAAGAEVTALDASETRMERLTQNLQRVGLSAETIVADALDWQPEAPFDAVLVDAPCSATGTIRRHPDLPYRTKGGIDMLTGLQAHMLAEAARWVKPGGTLVFCTCSILKAEGEEQAVRALSGGTGLVADPIAPEDGLPEAFVTEDGQLRTLPDLWPERGGLDGFFAARFRREA